MKRLAGLMGTPIGVRSRVGHGTLFSIELPVGKAVRSTDPATATARVPIGLTLRGRFFFYFFFFFEGEAAVHEGLVVLLQARGARVAAFDCVDAARAWAADGGPASRPDLLFVDYRLRQGQTGIDALSALRARWPGQHLPAFMITGSSVGGHEDEAVTHDDHLLVKPILPNKRRAMIALKLDLRPPPAGG